MALTKQQKQLNTACWWLYLSAVTLYVTFVILGLKVPLIEQKSISIFATFLLSVTIFLSISVTSGFKKAVGLLLYWAVIVISFENYYLSTGRYEFPNNEVFKILGNVPFNLYFNWLIPLFALYSLGTYITSRFLFKNKSKKLITHLLIDILLILSFGLLHDPMNVALGYWKYNPSPNEMMIFDVPLFSFFEYFIGALLINLPIRWFEIYRQPPRSDIYYLPKVSYPLYFG